MLYPLHQIVTQGNRRRKHKVFIPIIINQISIKILKTHALDPTLGNNAYDALALGKRQLKLI